MEEVLETQELQEPKWYILHTYSSYEQMVKTNIEQMVVNNHFENKVFDIKIPTEQSVEERNGKKKVVEVKSMPGYVFVKLIVDNDIIYHLTAIRGVTNFVGPMGKPTPIDDAEVRRFHLEKIEVADFNLKVGDSVNIIGGAFEGMVGVISSVDIAKQKAGILLNMFGRETNVEMEFEQIEAIEK